jgi:hypothetical protein
MLKYAHRSLAMCTYLEVARESIAEVLRLAAQNLLVDVVLFRLSFVDLQQLHIREKRVVEEATKTSVSCCASADAGESS